MSNNDYQKQLIMLGLNIARYRRLRGMTQQELALEASMSRTHLSNLEAPGKAASISLEKLFAIASALHIPVSALFDFDKS